MHDWPMLLIYPIFQHIVVELVRREECNGGVHSVLYSKHLGFHSLFDESFEETDGHSFGLGKY